MKVRAVTMAIFRTMKENGDFVTVHKSFIFDSNLSAKAKGILLYFLSRPDDWQIYTSEVVKNMNDGQKSINSGINELIEAGYVERSRKRKENGDFNGYEYLVYEKPRSIREMPFGENAKRENAKRINAKRENAKGQTTNNNRTNNDLTKNNNTKNDSSSYDTTTAYDFLLNNFVEMQNTNKQKEVSNLIQDIKDNTLDVVKVATNYCKENNKGLNYFIAVIKNWIADDVDTKEKALAKVKPNNKKHNKTDEVFVAMEKELNTNENKNQTIHEADNVFTFYENNGFGRLNSTIVEKIDAWREDFNGNDDIVIEALKEAINNNIYKWAYVNSILVSWYQEGINSVEDIEARKKQRNKLNSNKSFLDRLADDEEENSQYSELF